MNSCGGLCTAVEGYVQLWRAVCIAVEGYV